MHGAVAAAIHSLLFGVFACKRPRPRPSMRQLLPSQMVDGKNVHVIFAVMLILCILRPKFIDLLKATIKWWILSKICNEQWSFKRRSLCLTRIHVPVFCCSLSLSYYGPAASARRAPAAGIHAEHWKSMISRSDFFSFVCFVSNNTRRTRTPTSNDLTQTFDTTVIFLVAFCWYCWKTCWTTTTESAHMYWPLCQTVARTYIKTPTEQHNVFLLSLLCQLFVVSLFRVPSRARSRIWSCDDAYVWRWDRGKKKRVLTCTHSVFVCLLFHANVRVAPP